MSKIKLKLEVYNKKSFIRSLIDKKIPLYNIEDNDNYINITIDTNDYSKIIKMKTIKKVIVLKVYGFSGLLFYFKKYYLLFIFVLVGIIINLILSNLILSIKVICPNKELSKRIVNDLKELGIYKYHFSYSYDYIQDIKNKLLIKEKNNVEWLEIEKSGTKYIIKVEEKKLNKDKEVCLPRNIVSLKDSIITRIEGIEGEIVKSKNEFVSKGDVIISGVIHNGEDIVSKKCAEGIVYGEVWYRVSFSLPKYKKNYYRTHKKHIGIYYNNKYKTKFLNYDIDKYSVINSYLIPFDIGIAKYYEKEEKIIKNNYSLKDIYKISDKLITSKGVILRKKILKKEIKDSRIIIEVFYSIEEEITDYQIIE